jgi:hypothetical protein
VNSVEIGYIILHALVGLCNHVDPDEHPDRHPVLPAAALADRWVNGWRCEMLIGFEEIIMGDVASIAPYYFGEIS